MSDAWVRPCPGQVANLHCTAGCVRASKHHESAAGISCLPSARPGHLLRSGGSELGRDCAAYLSYRLTCCETPVWRVTDWFGVCLVTVSRVVCRWWAVRHRTTGLFSCFLVEGSRLSSPLTGRVEILNHQKKLTGLSIAPHHHNQSKQCHITAQTPVIARDISVTYGSPDRSPLILISEPRLHHAGASLTRFKLPRTGIPAWGVRRCQHV